MEQKKLLRWLKARKPLKGGAKNPHTDGEWAQTPYGVYVCPTRCIQGRWKLGHVLFLRGAEGNPFTAFWESTASAKADAGYCYISWIRKQNPDFTEDWMGRSKWEAEKHAHIQASLPNDEERICADAAQMLGDMFVFVRDFKEEAKEAARKVELFQAETRRRRAELRKRVRATGSKTDWKVRANQFDEAGWGGLVAEAKQ